MYYISMCTDPHICIHKHIYTCIFPISMLATCKFYLHVHLLFCYMLPLPYSPRLRKQNQPLDSIPCYPFC